LGYVVDVSAQAVLIGSADLLEDKKDTPYAWIRTTSVPEKHMSGITDIGNPVVFSLTNIGSFAREDKVYKDNRWRTRHNTWRLRMPRAREYKEQALRPFDQPAEVATLPLATVDEEAHVPETYAAF